MARARLGESRASQFNQGPAQAMALALIYPEPEKGGRGKKSEARNSTVSVGFSQTRLNVARSVLRHSPDLAGRVVKGSVSLDDALAKVEEAKAACREKSRAGDRRSTPARLMCEWSSLFRGLSELRTAWGVDAVRLRRMDYFERV